MMQELANNISHSYRLKILNDWLPEAKATMANESFKNLWEAYFIFIDPDAVRKENCPVCLGNVLGNWRKLAPYIQEAEFNYNLLEAI